MFKNQSRSLAFVVGCLVGVIGAIFIGVAGSNPAAKAQLPPGVIGNRYQISSYGKSNGSGAYVLDNLTNEIYHVSETEKPRSVGTLPDSRPHK